MKNFLLIISTLLIFVGSIWANPIVLHEEDFEDCSTVSWTNIAASADADASDSWTCDNTTEGRISMSGFGGGSDEDWLVSPPIDLDATTNEYLLFNYKNRFSGADIELYYSIDFVGATYSTTELEAANWTAIPIDLFDISADPYVSNLLPHMPIDLSTITGTAVYFAFRYQTDPVSGDSETWDLDNIKIEADYYGSIDVTSDDCVTLKTTLNELINDHQVIPYTGSELDVWDSHYVTDRQLNDAGSADIVLNRYGDNPSGPDPYEFTLGEDRDIGVLAGMEGVYYNREHVFPRSWWGGSSTSFVDTQYTDIHAIIPADQYVNSLRSNFPMGEVGTPIETTLNGSALGASTSLGFTGTVFEPIDEYKGDLARIFLYMAVRYEQQIAGWETSSSTGDGALSGDTYTVYESWFLDQMMAWHAADPVSQLEKDRNNAIYAIQGNRNPFIDNAAFAENIWGTPCFLLPVELLAFQANKHPDGVLLHWKTTSELNNDYFVIEHSLDGINFHPIGQESGAGNSSQLNTYTYLHRQPSIGDNYYRLQQVDFDGKVKTLPVKVIKMDAKNSIRLFPNPVTDQLVIQQNFDGPVMVIIKNMYGNVVHQLTLQNTTEKLDLNKFPIGTYLFEIWENGNFTEAKRVVKITP